MSPVVALVSVLGGLDALRAVLGPLQRASPRRRPALAPVSTRAMEGAPAITRLLSAPAPRVRTGATTDHPDAVASAATSGRAEPKRRCCTG